jgi:hypothetical protein
VQVCLLSFIISFLLFCFCSFSLLEVLEICCRFLLNYLLDVIVVRKCHQKLVVEKIESVNVLTASILEEYSLQDLKDLSIADK